MKKTCIIAVLGMSAGLAVLGQEATGTNAAAKPAHSFAVHDLSGDMTGRFGVGLIAGEPIGASAKYFFNDRLAIDGAIGWSSHSHSDMYFHSDVLWHCYDLLPVPRGRLPVYFGVGGLFRARNHGEDNQAGIRLPVGVSYQFDNAPVDIFVEIGPALDVAPGIRGEITGGVGVRFWF